MKASMQRKKFHPTPEEKFKIKQQQKLKLYEQLNQTKKYKSEFLSNENRWCNNCLLVNCQHNNRDCNLPYTGLKEIGQRVWRKTARIAKKFKLNASLTKEDILDVLLTRFKALLVQKIDL